MEADTIGKNLYLTLVRGGKDFFVVHKHLQVLTLESNSDNFVIDNAFLNEFITHIFVFEIKDNTFLPVGGIPRDTLATKAIQRDPLLIINRCYFKPDHHYNHNDFVRENTNSVVSDETCFSYFSKNPDLRARFKELTRDKGVPLHKLLQNRFLVLRNINDNFKHLNNDRISSDRATKDTDYILQNTLFEDLPQSGLIDPDLLHYLSQKLMEFCVVEGSKDGHCTEWIALQEERILRFQLLTRYNTEAGVLTFLKTNKLLTRSKNNKCKLRLELDLESELNSECRRLFSLQFPECEAPSYWFSCNICTCLELGLESLSGSKLQVQAGRAYFSYKHIVGDWLPKALFKFITDPRGHQLTRLWSDSENRELIAMTINIKKEIGNIRASSASPIDLPDIEDTAGLAPPCITFLLTQLIESKTHLKFNQRKQYSGYLTDAGWDKLTIETHLKKHDMNCGISEQMFETKYKQIADRKFILDSNGKKWYGRDGKSPICGWGCEALTKMKATLGSGDCYGCPMRFMPHDQLSSFLTGKYGIDPAHVPEILNLSAQRKYQMACGKTFERKFNGFYYPGNKPWFPASPHGYFFHAIRKQRFNDILQQ